MPESGYSRTLRALEPPYRSTWQIQLSFARAVPITILSGCICERGDALKTVQGVQRELCRMASIGGKRYAKIVLKPAYHNRLTICVRWMYIADVKSLDNGWFSCLAFKQIEHHILSRGLYLHFLLVNNPIVRQVCYNCSLHLSPNSPHVKFVIIVSICVRRCFKFM